MDNILDLNEDTVTALTRSDNPKLLVSRYYDMLMGRFIKENFQSPDVNAGFIPSSAILAFKGLVMMKKALFAPELQSKDQIRKKINDIVYKMKSIKFDNRDYEQEYECLDLCYELLEQLNLLETETIAPIKRDIYVENILNDKNYEEKE